MKKYKTLIIVAALVALSIVSICFLPQLLKTSGGSDTSSASSSDIDLSKYNLNTVIGGTEDNGYIADHVKGDPDAPATIFEYADYQCSGCASAVYWIKQLLKEYDGKVKIVFRGFPLTMHKNAIAASSAVEAAGLQGYWEAYGDLVFANQGEWFYSTGTERTEYFMSYFTQIAGEDGDLAKFRSDMASAEVKQKVNFDLAISKSLDIDATPAFFGEDGKEIEWIQSSDQTIEETLEIFRNYIDKQLEEKTNETK